MEYVSTRGAAPPLEFEDVLITGLAPDGGLYVPNSWPDLTETDLRALAGLSYADAAWPGRGGRSSAMPSTPRFWRI